MSAYLELEEIFKKLNLLDKTASVISWDSSTMMPKGGYDIRGEQMAFLQASYHEIVTDSKIAKLLDKAESLKGLSDWREANLKLMRNEWKQSSCINEELIKKQVIAATKCEAVWRDAKKENDFKKYAPLQQEVLEISREIANTKAEAFKLSPYDALLNQYDEGRKSEQIDKIFAELKSFLPDLIQKIHEKQKAKKIFPFKGPFSIEKQKALSKKFMEILGFDFNQGRLDESAHPFTSGYKGDVRLTTRYNEDEFLSALMGTFHETGHANYDQNVPEEWQYQPVGQPQGMTIHESQSLLVENLVGHSNEFIKFMSVIIKKEFEGAGPVWSVENFYNINNRVEPSLIRVEADEVTYPIHIIIRYEIEKDLINNKIQIKDVPDIWNGQMKELLGIEVPDYAHGCMQDIHWSDGSFGYFPTYTLGAMAATQFFDAATKQNPDILPQIEKGNFSPLSNWLKDNIHSYGSRYTSNELIEKVTGKELGTETFKKHLEDRYWYGL